jgi:hypothetical protein
MQATSRFGTIGPCHKSVSSPVFFEESGEFVLFGGIMRGRTIAYWIATVFVACVMSISGCFALGHVHGFVDALAHLGYPPYFAYLLGAGKVAGVGVLLAPRLGRFKEWAYAAFGIVVVSACYSHYQAGDGALRALEPMVTGVALVISYALRPASRRMAIGYGAEVGA